MSAPSPGNSRYPGPGDMPEMATPQPGTPESGKSEASSNPVLGALQTIQTWISAMAEKGQPGVDEFKQKFMELLQAASKMGQQADNNGGPGTVPPVSPAGGNPNTTPPPVPAGPNAIKQSPMNAAGNPAAKPMI